uniref:Uncharacterized protein n=1 Tax=Picea sitchensis TaxID=3332 RepID=A9P0K7_PICSI|nr:unknown [Picea sitchensis]
MLLSSVYAPCNWRRAQIRSKAELHLDGQRSFPSTQLRSRSIDLKFRSMNNHQRAVKISATIRNEQAGFREHDGVIIVDHGSRRQESNCMLDAFVDMYKKRTGHPIVELAHMELAQPTIKEAFDSCVNQGAARVIISPYFLSPGRHWKQDIPSLAAEAAKEHPGVPYIVTAPLGLHELMVNVIEDRIKYCLSHVAGDSAECEMCSGTGQCQQRAT